MWQAWMPEFVRVSTHFNGCTGISINVHEFLSMYILKFSRNFFLKMDFGEQIFVSCLWNFHKCASVCMYILKFLRNFFLKIDFGE